MRSGFILGALPSNVILPLTSPAQATFTKATEIIIVNKLIFTISSELVSSIKVLIY